MATGNAVISDKMQFQSGGGSSGNGEIHHPRQWVPDERDGFIMWLRGEFAAANAIIDGLCYHLRCIGDPGEYDFAVGCIQQRRCNWSPVLHMQQYFSVGEVTYALQQVAWRRQQRVFDHQKGMEKEIKRSGFGYRHAQKPFPEPPSRDLNSRDLNSSATVNGPDKNLDKGEQRSDKEEEGKLRDEIQLSEEKVSVAVKDTEGEDGTHVDCNPKNVGNSPAVTCTKFGPETIKDGSAPELKGPCKDVLPEGGVDTILDEDEKQKLVPVPKCFVGNEIFDQKMVNVVEGLKLYEELLDSSEISKLVSLANEMRAAGRRGELEGLTYVASKRPTKGHGREMIQLGVPMADGPPEDEQSSGTSKDRKVEPIPSLLQDVINKFLHLQVTTSKPDACMIDFFNEGDHSQPHPCPPWFGRPISILALTECDIVFGRFIATEHPGEYKGSLKLSLSAGSLLVMQGKSADFAKHAFSTLRKQRILVTFTKSHPKKTLPADNTQPPLAPAVAASPSPSSWGPTPSRPPNVARHPAGGPKHFGAAAAAATGVLPAPSINPQRLPAPNGIQPLFMTAAVAPPVPYPTPVPPLPPASAAWQVVPPRPATPRLPVPGTGVFLPPPGSAGHSPTSQQGAGGGGGGAGAGGAAEASGGPVEMSCTSESETVGPERSNSSGSTPKGRPDGNVQRQDCNGSANSVGGGKVLCKEEQQNVSHKKKVASKAAAAVK